METSPLSPSSYALVTWRRPTSISLDVYDSKIWKANRCRPVASSEINLATNQEFYLTKVATIQTINRIVLLDFSLIRIPNCLLHAALPFILPFIFDKKFLFSNVYVPVNTISQCLDMLFGWDRGNQLSTYATGRGTGSHPNCVQLQGEGISRPMRTYALTLSLFMSWKNFCYTVCCLFVEIQHNLF